MFPWSKRYNVYEKVPRGDRFWYAYELTFRSRDLAECYVETMMGKRPYWDGTLNNSGRDYLIVKSRCRAWLGEYDNLENLCIRI